MKQNKDEYKNKSNKGGRGNRRPNTKGKKKQYDKDEVETSKLDNFNRDNDPNWYFLDKMIAEQASSFSFNSYLGVPDYLTFDTYTGGTPEQVHLKYNAPSVMAINLAPSPGDTSSVRTGINLAALKTYTRLSNANAKTTAYAPQDVTMLILSVGELLSILEHIRRAFGFAFTYNQRNRSMPAKVLDMMGFDSDDFLTNIAQHRLQFNSWITAINKLPILSNINYLHKCASLYQKVYLDSTSNMGQIVFMRPYSTWVLNETLDEQGSVLEETSVPSKGKWSEWVKLVDSIISSLFESSTFNYIYSDILNFSTKTGAKLLYMDWLPEGYTVVPEYNRNFLLQYHNLHVAGLTLGKDSFTTSKMPTGYTENNNVYADVNKNMIKYNPLFGDATGSQISTPLIDMDVPEANLVDRIESTRFISVTEKVATGDTKTVFARRVVSLPDHYVVSFAVSDNLSNSTGTIFAKQYLTDNATFAGNEAFIKLTQFDWAPLVYIVNISKKTSEVLGDLNYWTTLDGAWFRRVNDLTFQALFELQ